MNNKRRKGRDSKTKRNVERKKKGGRAGVVKEGSGGIQV